MITFAVTEKYRSHHDKTVKICGPLHLQDNAFKSRHCFFTFDLNVRHHSLYISGMATPKLYLFRTVWHFLGKNCLITSKGTKIGFTHFLP